MTFADRVNLRSVAYINRPAGRGGKGSALVWTGKELAVLAGDPIGYETHPFARSRIDKTQPFDEMVGELQEIVAAARSPVDRIRLRLKSDFAKDADRPWHMMGRRHQQPSLAALRRHQGLGNRTHFPIDPRERRVKLSHKLGLFIKIAVA